METMQLLPAFVVDRLPSSWWRPGNLHFLASRVLHFCCDHAPEVPHVVRSIELDGRVLARGRRPFDLDRWNELDGH